MRRGFCAYPCHDWTKEEEYAFPMAFHVLLWQLNADSKDTDGEHDTGDFEGDLIGDLLVPVRPASWVEDIPTIGADDHAEEECPDRLTNVQLAKSLRRVLLGG
jgi:hypothetical protein